jgi:hypothetical protein
MRANTFGFIVVGAVLASATAQAQDALPPPSANSGSGTGAPETSPASSTGTPEVEALPPPVAGGPSGSDAANAAGGTAMPAAPSVKAPSPSDWQFSWHGYFRAPLRLGVGHRQQCAPTAPGSTAMPMMTTATSPVGGVQYGAQFCAQPGESRTTIHSPYIPDDQYLSWTFDRQWEQAWAEVFLSYGNDHIVGTVGIQGYDFADTTLLGNQADPAQFGIAQAWVTMTPDLPVDGLRLNWKVGSFWEKFGMAGKYDGGHYDTYMFGRTHTMGESLALEYDAGDVTLKVEHGFGAHLEMVPAGITLSGSSDSLNYANTAAGNAYPPGGSPGVTLLNHFHLGMDWKKKIQINAHYLMAWSQDDRVQGTLTSNGNPVGPDGSMSVYGGEARFLGGVFGELYAGYSHIHAVNVTEVGPAIEAVHSMGGGGHNGANGLYENFFNASGNGDGNIDTFQAGYDFSFGYLWRKLAHPNAAFWGDGTDVKLSLFTMYSVVSGTDPTSISPYNGRATDGTKKLKFGADLVANLLPWFGIGVRGDYVLPDSHDVHQTFAVISPKLIFRTKFITHEEVTMQYSHYWDGVDVLPQQALAEIGTKNIGQSFTSSSLYPNDGDVFGIKATMWW